MPFKFDTPSPDEKNIATCGLKKTPTRVVQSLDNILNGTKNSITRVGVIKSTSSALPNPNIRRSVEGTGSSTSKNQVQVLVHDSQVGNESSIGVSSIPSELADTLRRIMLKSYVPESWMLQDSNNDFKQLLHFIVVGHVDIKKSTLMGRILHLLGQDIQKESK